MIKPFFPSSKLSYNTLVYPVKLLIFGVNNKSDCKDKQSKTPLLHCLRCKGVCFIPVVHRWPRWPGGDVLQCIIAHLCVNNQSDCNDKKFKTPLLHCLPGKERYISPLATPGHAGMGGMFCSVKSLVSVPTMNRIARTSSPTNRCFTVYEEKRPPPPPRPVFFRLPFCFRPSGIVTFSLIEKSNVALSVF